MAHEPLFHLGQVIHHRRYDYRGVIIALDARCEADEAWYQSNQTQPDREQPWYHVLVDQARHTTYVAQENLEPDPSGGPVEHPMLSRFFKSFFRGCYHREHLN